MRLNGRVGKLERRCPVVVTRRAVPTGSFEDFVGGFVVGAFTAEDIDPSDGEQTEFAALLNTLLVVASPAHRAWCDANPWAPRPEALLATYSEHIRSAIRALVGTVAGSS